MLILTGAVSLFTGDPFREEQAMEQQATKNKQRFPKRITFIFQLLIAVVLRNLAIRSLYLGTWNR